MPTILFYSHAKTHTPSRHIYSPDSVLQDVEALYDVTHAAGFLTLSGFEIIVYAVHP
jgi:hypothetical protein